MLAVDELSMDTVSRRQPHAFIMRCTKSLRDRLLRVLLAVIVSSRVTAVQLRAYAWRHQLMRQYLVERGFAELGPNPRLRGHQFTVDKVQSS